MLARKLGYGRDGDCRVALRSDGQWPRPWCSRLAVTTYVDGLRQTLKQGDSFPVTLRSAKGGPVTAMATVELASQSPTWATAT